MRAVWLLPSLAGLSRRRIASGVSEASRFSCTECPDVLGVYDYAGPTRSSRSRCWSCCLPPFGRRRRPDFRFSKLDTQPIFSPVYASLDVSQHPAQNSGPSGSLLLSRKALSSSIPCRFSPAHPNVLFACVWHGQRKPWTIISGAREGGIYKSTDGGETWTKLGGGLPHDLFGRSNVSISAASPNRIYALIEAK